MQAEAHNEEKANKNLMTILNINVIRIKDKDHQKS